MTEFTDADLSDARFAGTKLARSSFVDADLSKTRFVRSDLSGAVMRAVNLDGADLDDPWVTRSSLFVNGVDVAPLVDAELNRRFPGREQRRAQTPDDLRDAWAAAERAWAAAMARAEGMPAGTVDASVDGEWSFAQTLRHLVLATDIWFGQTVLGAPEPLHPIGQPHAEYATDGFDLSVFSEPTPAWERVLEVRAERQAMVRDFIAAATPERLAERRRNPWAADNEVSVLGCLHVILTEEWEHLRFAVRDLDALAATADASSV